MTDSDSTNVTWAYLAGFTDGDGCLSHGIRHRNGWEHHWFTVRWGQTADSRMVVDAIADFLHSHDIGAQNVSVSVKHTRLGADYAELAIQRHAEVRKVLIQMMPYLVLKRQKAEEMLAVLDNHLANSGPAKTWERRRARYGPTGRRGGNAI